MVHVLVIGAYGSAGVAAAERLAEEPAVDRLTLVDNGDPGGGLCILKGCMPSKELLSAAAHRYNARHDHRLDADPTLELQSVVDTKEEHVQGFAAHRRAAVEELAAAAHVEFIHSTARFVDDRTVEVDDRRFEPDYVVLASGSTVNIPALPGIEDVDYQTSADVLDTTTVPDSGVVMGFGVVGLELVSYLHEAGVEDLTVVEHDARPLDQADPAFGDAALDIYREEFDIDVLTHTVEQRVEPTAAGGVRLHVERDGTPETVEAEQLYLFTGRRPNVDSLGLDATALDPGVGWVEDTMQARDDDRVFVAGDVTGTDLLLHVAKEEGYTAAENIRRHAAGDQLNAYSHIHHQVIFSGASVYPYARVGHSEASAEAAGIDYVSATRDAASDGVFKTKATPLGLATLVVDADDGTVLGYQGLHYHADVMAKTMQVVVETEMAVTDVPDRAFHPTTPEIIDGLVRETAAEIADR